VVELADDIPMGIEDIYSRQYPFCPPTNARALKLILTSRRTPGRLFFFSDSPYLRYVPFVIRIAECWRHS
jgi:hypothetical protein